MDTLEEMRVYMRNLITDEWVDFAPGEWIDQYESRVFDALAIHGATFGGTLAMTGTPEHGRITIYASPLGEVIVDYDWFTMAVSEASFARQAEPTAAEPAPPQPAQPQQPPAA